MQADIAKSQYYISQIRNENSQLKKQLTDSKQAKQSIQETSSQGKSLAIQDTKKQLDELFELRDELADSRKSGLKSVSGAVKSQLKQRLKSISTKISEDFEKEKAELNILYDEGETVTQQLKQDEESSLKLKSKVNEIKKIVSEKN